MIKSLDLLGCSELIPLRIAFFKMLIMSKFSWSSRIRFLLRLWETKRSCLRIGLDRLSIFSKSTYIKFVWHTVRSFIFSKCFAILDEDCGTFRLIVNRSLVYCC